MPQTLPLRKFLNIGGEHREGGKLYKRGRTIETTRDLATIFPNHFRELGVPEKVDPISMEDNGEPIKSDTPKPALPEPVVDEGGLESTKHNLPQKSKFGEDVTEEFKKASEGGLKVFFDGTAYAFTDATDINVAIGKGIETKDKAFKAIAEFLKN